jgi:cysteine desulfurase / selenocysteine lyase
MIYLDNAATSWPKPETVYQTMDKFLREKGGNPGHGSHSLAEAARLVIDETRLLAVRFINAPKIENVIFTQNSTDSINMGMKGLLKPGDHVIISSLEHNAVMRPLAKMTCRGVTVTKVPLSEKTGVTSSEDIERAITPETKLIIVNHASNVNGCIQPIEEHGLVARKHDLTFMVDAAQSAGHIPIDVQAENIDLLAFSAHKGTLGPPGVGVLYVGPRVNPDTLKEGGTGSSSESEEQPDAMPYKFESGTLNTVGIAGFGAGLKYINETGLEKIAAHDHKLIVILKEELLKIQGVSIFSAKDDSRQLPVVSFNIQGYTPGEVGAILDQAFDIKVRTGLHCSPCAHKALGTFPLGTVRLSPGYFNSLEETETVIQAVRKIAGQ